MITEANTKEIYDITGMTPLAGGYEFTFPYTSAQDVRVYTTGNRIDTEVSTSNYTIDRSGATPKVVFTTGYSFPAGQTKLTIIRNVSYSQELDLRNGDLIDADKLEGALDDITQQIQQVAEKVDRAILSSVSDIEPLSIPEASQRNNMLLGFDNEGKAIPVLTTDIEQKLAQALAAEESAITAKNAAENAQHEAESAQSAAETAQEMAETAQAAAESAETSSQAILVSISTKTEESIASINTTKTGAVGAVTTQQATSVAAVQAAQNTAESDIAGKRASALTAIDTAKTAAVAAVNTQKETSVAAADREIVAKRDSALTDIQTARTNAVNAITSQKDTSLQEIEQLTSERKAEINSLAANQKADVKQYTDGVVASAKTDIDTEKTKAVTAVQEEGDAEVTRVQSVYQTDLNELKGDLSESITEILNASKPLINISKVKKTDDVSGSDVLVSDGNIYTETPRTSAPYTFFGIDKNEIKFDYKKMDYYGEVWIGVHDGTFFYGSNLKNVVTGIRRCGKKATVTNYSNANINKSVAFDPSDNKYHSVSAKYDAESKTFIAVADNNEVLSFTLTANIDVKGIAILDYGIPMYSIVNARVSSNYADKVDSNTERIENLEQMDVDVARIYQKGASPKKYDTQKKLAIICAGQSNTDGRVPAMNLPSYINLPLSNAHFTKNEQGVFYDVGTNYYSALGWAYDLVTLYYLTQVDNIETYIMKKAMGGTSIDITGASDYHWTVDYEKLDDISNSLLRSFENVIRGGMKTQGDNIEIRAFLWHQGEGDRGSYSAIASKNYYKNLKSVVAYIRGVVGNERLPFICGTVSHASLEYDANVESALYKLQSEDAYFKVIDMKDAVLSDGYHFDAEWSEYLGKMMHDELVNMGVITANKINPQKPI